MRRLFTRLLTKYFLEVEIPKFFRMVEICWNNKKFITQIVEEKQM
jgi:hypothetical protein